MPSDKTQESLLEAATNVFSEKGFSGARVDEIARKARVNKAMIYYHFGAKEDLYQAVLQRLFGRVLAEIDRVSAEASEPRERLVAFYRALGRLFSENPGLPHIMLREVQTGGRHISAGTAKVFSRILQFISGTIAEGVHAAAFRPVDPKLVHLTVIGPLLLFFVSEPFRARILPMAAPGSHPPTWPQMLDHVMDFLTRGLAPAAPPQADVPGRGASDRRS